jgi:REP element-mobilizing transposase RayT
MTTQFVAIFQGFRCGSIPVTRGSMPRPFRIQEAGLLRHVVSRGVGKMKIFLDDGDRHAFLFLLAAVVQEYGLDCYDYCLMDNHFHLSILNRRRNLSAAMQKLKGEYASSWNVKHRRVGHVFEGPFKDQIVQQSTYFRILARYIARNPVRAGLVRTPEEWLWSSYRFHAGLALPPEFLAVDRVLQYFQQENRDVARAAYITYVSSLSDAEEDAALFRSRRRVLGDPAFRAAVKANRPVDRRPGVSASSWPSAQFASLPV